MKTTALVVAGALAVLAAGMGSRSLLPWLQAAPQASATPPPVLQAGDVLAPFDAQGIDGVSKHISFPEGTNTVLLFFLSGCPHCHRMMPEWNRAFAGRPPNLAVVGVLMDMEPPGFLEKMPVAFPVVRAPSIAFLHSIKVYRAPLTLRVAPGGRVEDLGPGELEPLRLLELFRR